MPEQPTSPRDDRTKAQWRSLAFANREGLRVDHVRVCAGLARFLERRPHRWVVGYWPLPGEPDLRLLWERTDLGPFALTRTPEAGFDLTIHPVEMARERHRLGFEQPVAHSPVVADHEIDVILVPGLAFDLAGTRLGHGAGYYDRLLARLGPSVTRIGVTDGYLVNRLPRDRHDVPMTHLATEIGVVPIGWK